MVLLSQLPQRPVAGQVIGSTGDGSTEQPQDPTFHTECPRIPLDFPSRDQIAGPSSQSNAGPSHYPSSDGSGSASWQSASDGRWTSADHHTNSTSSWQHTGAGWSQSGSGFSYSNPLVSNQAYSAGIDWGAAAFQYAAAPTQDGELDFTPLGAHSAHAQMSRGDWGAAAFQYAAAPTRDGELDFTHLGAHSAHAQMSRGRPPIVPSSRIEPQSHLTVAVRPFRGGETQSADGARSNDIQVHTGGSS